MQRSRTKDSSPPTSGVKRHGSKKVTASQSARKKDWSSVEPERPGAVRTMWRCAPPAARAARTPPRGNQLSSTRRGQMSFVSSALCKTYIYVHLFFALAGLVFSLYLGSAWYDRMLTSHVTKKVRKHIAASTAKKD